MKGIPLIGKKQLMRIESLKMTLQKKTNRFEITPPLIRINFTKSYSSE